ncbi:MAG: hypothetical protein Q9213_001019, partial [Squamulea squamosa]
RQHVLLDVGSGTGNRLKTFVQEHKTLEHELQIHAFEPNTAHLAKLQAALRSIKTSLPAVAHDAAAWIADEEVTITVERPQVGSAKHFGGLGIALMQRLVGSFRGKGHPTDMSDDKWQRQQQLQVQALDFSKWLLENIRQDDHVYLQMDAAGAEYLLMQQMIVDGSVLLVDEISIVWHDGTTSFLARWPDLIEDLVTKLGLQSNGVRHL